MAEKTLFAAPAGGRHGSYAMRLKIANGQLFDPASGFHGQVGDLYVEGDRLVPHLDQVDEVLDARGLAVLAGGIDLRAPVAGFGLPLLALRGQAAAPCQVGEAYALLGYTHVHEPCLTLTTAAAVHRQLAALAVVDASASLLVNLRDFDLALKDPGALPEVGATLSHLLERHRCLDLRLAEPFVRYRQEYYRHRAIETPRALELLAQLAELIGRRFTLEAQPELWQSGLPTPARFHLAGLSRALARDEDAEAAAALLQAGATGDLGLAWPRPPALPVRVDLGGFAPLLLNPQPEAAAVGRALGLALENPGGNLAFSSLGPVSQLTEDYPRLLGWLWHAQTRPREWHWVPPDKTWSLADWAMATRALPARILGLADRGRLAPGARADVALYDLPPEDQRAQWPHSLGRCRILIKAGEVVVKDFTLIRPEAPRHTLFRQSGAPETGLVHELCQERSLRPENLWMAEALGGPFEAV